MSSKALLALAVLLGAATSVRAADYSVILADVHLCCNSCVKDAKDAVGPIDGTTVDVNKDTHTISIKASDLATAQKAVNALTDAGYYGVPNDPNIHLAQAVPPAGEVQSLKVSGVHLCCKKCVSTVNMAVKKVQGVTGTTAAKDAESFEITGNFNAGDVLDALHAAGFSAKVD